MATDKHEIDYEKADVEPRKVMNAGIVVGVVTVLASVAVLGMLNMFSDLATKADPAAPPLGRHEQGRLAPEPRLQVNPFLDVRDLAGSEKTQLESSGWIDEQRGLARIPVEDAIRHVAQKGLPRFPPAPASPAASTAASPAVKGEGAR